MGTFFMKIVGNILYGIIVSMLDLLSWGSLEKPSWQQQQQLSL